MLLYLVRHAEAVDGKNDALRALSPHGRAQVAQLVTQFQADGRFQPAELWHSPLVRAVETATLLKAGLALTAPLHLQPGLEPEDSPRALLPRLTQLERNVALVGHEPFMSALASLLAHGDENYPAFAFQKGSVVAFARVNEAWALQWKTAPAR